ncbi:MAG: hypothetical protein ACLT5W_01815 [Ruminococcus sp.]
MYKLQFKDKTTLDIYSFFEVSNGEALQIAVQRQTYDALKVLFEDVKKTSEMIISLNDYEVGHYYSMTYITGWTIKPNEDMISVTLKVSGYDEQIEDLTSQVTETKNALNVVQGSVTELKEQVADVPKITEKVNTLNNQVVSVEKKVDAIDSAQYGAMIDLLVGEAQLFSNEKALEYQNLYEEWKVDTLYPKDYKVNFTKAEIKTLYKCLTEHTSQESWTPDAAPSLWAKVLIPDPSVIPDWEQPLSTNPYMKGDNVKHKGKTWESLVDNNVWEPGVIGTEGQWKEVTE